MRQKTWNVLRWDNPPEHQVALDLCCDCGYDAALPMDAELAARTIAAFGLKLVLDPPGYKPADNAMPDEIKCRRCRRIFEGHKFWMQTEVAHVG